MAVSLLGGLRISAGMASLEAGRLGRRAQVALARLALDAGSGVSREALADAVWGGSMPETWRGSLRNVIGELRRELIGAGLEGIVSLSTSERGYVLDLPAGSSVDVLLLREETVEVARLLAAGEYPVALELAELSLRAASGEVLDGVGGEDWVEGLRAEVAELRVELELLAGDAALRLGDAARAQRLARHVIGQAPLREEGHRQLIRALRAAGNRAEALAAYDACRRQLASELGALPSPATQELFLEILAQERSEQPRLGAAEGSVPATGALLALARSSPFVGRSELLSWLGSRAQLVGEAGMFVVCLSGEPGLGKTRLAAELAAGCHRDGLGVLYGRCQERLGVPYAALLEALERGLASVDRDRLRTWVSDELIDALAGLVPWLGADRSHSVRARPTTPALVRRAIGSILRALGGERGALLVFDDAQWASRAELEVLEELLADPEAARLFVVVLHRDPDDDAALPRLGEHPRLARRELEPLAVEDVAALAALTTNIGGEADAAQRARALWRASGGNPLLAAELLDAPLVPGGSGPAVAVAGLVAGRLGSLPAGAQELLRLAAVAGLEFDAELVCAASAAGVERTRELLEAARAVRLLVDSDAGGEGRLEFRHGLVRDALLDGLDPGERARLHERLGAGLEEGGGSDPAALVSLAYHFAGAAPLGNWQRVLRYGLPVARQAYAAGAYEDVITLASRALQALERAGDPDPRVRLELQVLLGGAQRALGDHQGHQTLARAFADARERGDAVLMADAALAISPAGALSEALYLDDRQLGLYEQALQALGTQERGRRARLLARLAGAHAWRQGQALARPVGEQALALARELDDERTLAMVLAGVRLAMVGSGDVAELGRLERELEGVAERQGEPALVASAALWRYATSVQQGDGAHLEALLARAGEHARGLALGNLHHGLAFEHAALALLRGRTGEAEALVARAAQLGCERGLDPTVVESIRLTQMMLVRGEQQRLHELREEAAPLFGSAGVTMWQGALAVIDAAAGRLDGVGDRIDAVLDDYERSGPTALCHGGVIAYLTSTVLRLEDPSRVRRVRDLICPLSGQGAYFAGFAGPIDYHLALLHRHLGEHAEASRQLSAAAAFCERLGAPRWQARCRAALAGPRYG